MNKLIVAFFLVFSVLVQAQDVTTLTNEKVVEMVKAKIPTSVFITKIKNSSVKFVTDTPALKELSDASVPEEVISLMIERSVINETESKVLPPPPAPESRRAESPAFTPYRLLSKQEQKQRMKSPAQIAIAAPASKVQELLIRAFQSWNYQLESESSRALSFTRSANSTGASILAGMIGKDNVRHSIQVSMSEVSGITNVIVNTWIQMDNAFGKTTTERVNRKDDRAQLDDLLLAVKRAAEQEQ
jgi:hypothetical protein